MPLLDVFVLRCAIEHPLDVLHVAVLLNYHLGHLQLVGFQAVVASSSSAATAFHQTDFRHDVELGLVRRFALAGHDVDVYRLVVVGIELESQPEEYKQQRHIVVFMISVLITKSHRKYCTTMTIISENTLKTKEVVLLNLSISASAGYNIRLSVLYVNNICRRPPNPMTP